MGNWQGVENKTFPAYVVAICSNERIKYIMGGEEPHSHEQEVAFWNLELHGCSFENRRRTVALINDSQTVGGHHVAAGIQLGM